MHPEYNKERRKARAASLIKAHGDTTGVTFVDAAEYQDGHRFAAATTQGGSLKHAASIVTQNAETAEEVAIALAALDPDCHTIHNRVARTLASMHTNWNDERLFQTARRIVESEYQHVVYNEFLPAVLGDKFIEANGLRPLASGFTQYDKSVDATSINEFANTAFRFMHSNIDGTFHRLSASGRALPPVLLEREYFEVFHISATEGSLIRGLLQQPVRKFGRLGDRAVTQMLFRLPESPFGLDLFAIDIERGRDHGTASYAAYVERLFGITLSSFDDLHLRNLMPREVAMLYSDLYEDVRDIDLFSAGMNEPPLAGGDVGRTFAAIIAEEFRRLKLGDRFYYEHGGTGLAPSLKVVSPFPLLELIY
ncbi:hypothetical protein MTO96_020041 [Rhipicephalus appendiculatus]